MTVIRLTSLLFDTKNGLVVRERWEVRVPNGGAFSAPVVRSAPHRVANPWVA
ncbi:hypothetical protein ACFYNZ_20605 [Streptomyces kebangsaanensis]|uniref:Uncharacterized protein n=1 Tax=Streptomyces kebangsaanensis TaxID=864058 RepID=A0ABW6KZP7_9ACTN